MPKNRYTEQASDELKESLWAAPDRATELVILSWIERQGWVHEIVSDGLFAGEMLAVRFCKGQWWCFDESMEERIERGVV